MIPRPQTCLIPLVGALALALSACGSTAGGGAFGGGGQQPTMSASAEGSACNPASHGQGCYLDPAGAYIQMTCDGDSSKWKKAAACAPDQICREEADPADTTGFKKVTKCEAKPVAGADAGGSGGDISDGGGGGDGGVGPTDGGGQGGSDTSGGGDAKGTGPIPGPWLACAQKACKSKWAACSVNAGCKSGAGCVDGCEGKSECEQGCVKVAGTGQGALAVLMTCASEMECPKGGSGPKCGNGSCETGENASTCPSDCKTGPKCGDGKCQSPENASTCPSDCKTGPKCGDGKCQSPENASTCPSDCKTGPKCGDGKCEFGESASTCPADCGLPGPVCGDGKCEGSESASSCPKDCKTGPKCGDGKCESGESSASCPADCGGSTKTCKGKCGGQGTGGCYCDSKCSEMGDCCPDYALVCGGTGPKCGNGKCESGESSASCPADCGGGTTASLSACLKSKCASQTSACLGNAGCKGVYLFLVAGDCVNINKCGQNTACQQQKCGAEIQACMTNSGCANLSACLGKCKPTDQLCQGKCAAVGGTPWQSLGQCGQSKGCLK